MRGFDPDTEREILLALSLPALDFQPWCESPDNIGRHLHWCVTTLVDCCWVGLAEIAQPKLQAILGWIDGNSPPPVNPDGEDGSTFLQHYWWWESAALARWLVRDDGAASDFSRAVEARQNGMAQEFRYAPDLDPGETEEALCNVLPMILSADRAAIGAALYASRLRSGPVFAGSPAAKFGGWACAHIAAGGTRDANFVARGERMLRKTILEYFQYRPVRRNATLWLKAIYFDSGVTKTAEETILRAYDLMPGVKRCDVLSSHL